MSNILEREGVSTEFDIRRTRNTHVLVMSTLKAKLQISLAKKDESSSKNHITVAVTVSGISNKIVKDFLT